MRYIDADEFMTVLNDNQIDFSEAYRGLGRAKFLLSLQPTADVVPKSEVEQVKWERDVAIKQLEEIGLSFGEKTDGYGNLTEYAREIFEEIEKVLDNSVETEYFKGTWFNLNKCMIRIAELKKKYTEGKNG